MLDGLPDRYGLATRTSTRRRPHGLREPPGMAVPDLPGHLDAPPGEVSADGDTMLLPQRVGARQEQHGALVVGHGARAVRHPPGGDGQVVPG